MKTIFFQSQNILIAEKNGKKYAENALGGAKYKFK